MTTEVLLAFGVCAFVLLLFLASLLVPRSARSSRGTDSRLDTLAQRVDEIDGIARQALHDTRNLRMLAGGLATKDSVARVEVQVAEIRGQMTGLVSNTAATTRSISRIEDYLLSPATPPVIAPVPAPKTVEEKV